MDEYNIFCNLKELNKFYPNLNNTYIKEIINRTWLIDKYYS